MKSMRIVGLTLAFVGSGSMATPPSPTLNVMFQFICLSLSPPAYSGDTVGRLRPTPVMRTERTLGGRQASHRIIISRDRHIDITETLATEEECLRVPQNVINWVSSPNGERAAEFCITANPGLVDANVIVRIALPVLDTAYARQVMEELLVVSSCRIERGPYDLFPGDRFVVGRQLFVPRIDVPQ